MNKPIEFNLYTKLKLHVPLKYDNRLIIYFGRSDNDFCSKLALKTNCLVLEVNNLHFPMSIDIGMNIINYFMGDYKIILMGNGIGGNIATSLAMKLRDLKMINVERQVLICPVIYYDHLTSPFDSCNKYKPTFEIMDGYVNGKDRFNIYATPLMATIFTNMPKTLIMTASDDYLRDEGEIYSYLLHKSGNDVTIKRIDTVHNVLDDKIIGIIDKFLNS